MSKTCDSNSHSCPIVGASYRPPALTILSLLKPGTKLLLKPDPLGKTCSVTHDDPNAIAVFILAEEVFSALDSDAKRAAIEKALSKCNSNYTEFLFIPNEQPIHLGYIPRTEAAKIRLKESCEATLNLNLRGKPLVEFST